ncbi:MAG TPA: hypothetical protein VGH97_09320 [Thermoanaerobaculia bacterium]|jgi:hypothetical protein
MPAIVPAIVSVLALTVGESDVVRMPAAQASKPPAAAPQPCASPEHRQFDFWLGEWEVRESGKVAGANRISRILGGCALREEWTGAGGGQGTSLNVYDPARRRWHQTWADDKGLVLLLDGEWRNGRMVLEGERPITEGKTSRERISWTPQAGGRVRQLWESSADAGKTWQVVFDGIYAKK